MKTAIRFAASLILAAFSAITLTTARASDPLVPELVGAFTAGIPTFDSGAVSTGDGNFYGVTESGGSVGYGTLFHVPNSGPVEVLANFGDLASETRGQSPLGPLIFDGPTKLYGVTQSGGRFGQGTVFRVTLNAAPGMEVETLVDFTGEEGAAPGRSPGTALVRGADGNFYGTTRFGGPKFFGNVFRVSPQGRFEVLATFTGKTGSTPGSQPSTPLIQLSDGSFIGATTRGGPSDLGTIYRITAAGKFETVASFIPTGTPRPKTLIGGFPAGQLARTSDDTVYGLIRDSGNNTFKPSIWSLTFGNQPSVFVDLDNDSSSNTISNPLGGLVSDASNNLYVTMGFDGAGGGLYKITTAGLITKVLPFPTFSVKLSGGFNDAYGLQSDGAGGFVGAASGVLFRAPTPLSTINEIAAPNPDGGTTLGLTPDAGFAFAGDDRLVGHCLSGGANAVGTFFQLPLGGSLSLLTPLSGTSLSGVEFTTLNNNDMLFLRNGGGNDGSGAVYKLDNAGNQTIAAAFSFSNTPNNFARNPIGRLVSDGNGSFYGVASPPGFIVDPPDVAVIFKFDGTPTLQKLITVPKQKIGRLRTENVFPEGHISLDGNGNIRGILTESGLDKRGIIYQVTPLGVVTKLFDFHSAQNNFGGSSPLGPINSDGVFLCSGTKPQILQYLGPNKVDGLFHFNAHGTDHGQPDGSVALAPVYSDGAGNVYGVTLFGGAFNGGVLYHYDLVNDVYTVLYNFRAEATSSTPGFFPRGGLVSGPNGLLYGVCGIGGPNGGGTIFRLSTNPQATPVASAATNVVGNSAMLNGTITANGYSGEYWFEYGAGALDHETVHIPFNGFTGMQAISQVVSDLKGHTTYSFQLHVKTTFGGALAASSPLSFPTLNTAPLVQDDVILIDGKSTDYTGEVLANDVDLDGDTLSFGAIGTAMHGTVTIDGNNLIYHPDGSFAGSDSFTYEVKDDQIPALSSTATVNVLGDAMIPGEYAGLLFEEPTPSPIPREGAAIPSPDQIAAGFASLALGSRRSFSGRFEIDGRSVPVKGRLLAGRDTGLSGDRGRFGGSLRPVDGGVEARITYNGRTLVLRAGQAFAARNIVRPVSAYTMRFEPDEVEDPVRGPGLPPGCGYAVVRQDKKARGTLIGVLPDGTTFSKKGVIDEDGHFVFFTRIYRNKLGTFDGQLVLGTTDGGAPGNVDPVPMTMAHWTKPPQPRDTRFASGFSTTLTAFGGKFVPPARGQPVLVIPTGDPLTAGFDRGGLFSQATTDFTFTGAKAVANDASNTAHASAAFNARTGLVTGTFKPAAKAVKYRGVVVQRDTSVAGFFLGTADTGSVKMAVVP
jgi:uncharacterized repeat protein (TIGR03803 family)